MQTWFVYSSLVSSIVATVVVLVWLWPLFIKENGNSTSSNHKYLVESSKCHLIDWPLLDEETGAMFSKHSGQLMDCSNWTPFEDEIRVKRVNLTTIQIDFASSPYINWKCRLANLQYDSEEDKSFPGKELPTNNTIVESGRFDLERNLANRLINDTEGRSRWDAVYVICQNESEKDYDLVVPLIQKNFPKTTFQTYDISQKFTNASELNQTVTPGNSSDFLSKLNESILANESTTKTTRPTEQRANVIMVGIDSISRLNFHRHFIGTKQLLDRKGFIELKGHHKIGENTFPNMISIMTGNHYQRYHNFSNDDQMNMDGVRTIFDNYSSEGYVTTFVEDMPSYGLFNYKATISKPPTDYYSRPINLATLERLYNSRICYQTATEFKYYLDYLLDLMELFRLESANGVRHFTMSIIGSLTHDNLNHAGYADQLYLEFFEQFFAQNYHHNTYVIFFSDHGIRFGDITYTRSGQYEQRLPFLYVYVPEEARLSAELGPELLRERLRENQNRLTSMMDLHATLQHILTGDVEIANSGLFGRSLFGEISKERSCEEAGIGDHYCMCNQFVPVTNITELHRKIADSLVDYINQLLALYSDQCSQLTFHSIHKVMEREQFQTNQGTSTQLSLHFQTSPNGAIYEATVTYNPSLTKDDDSLMVDAFRKHPLDASGGGLSHWFLTGPISRLNRYGNQARCLTKSHYILRVYCYCHQH